MKPSQAQRGAGKQTYHLCLFGDPKSGKSTLAANLTLAGYKLLYISIDNGHAPIFKLPAECQDRIELLILPDTKDFPVATATVLKLLTGAPQNICDKHGQVECSACKKAGAVATWTRVCLSELAADTIVVIDNLSALASSVMNFVIKDSILKGMKDATGSSEKDPDVFKCGLDQYALQGRIMDKILTNIQQMAVNFVCISHPLETKMENGDTKLVPMIGTVNFSNNAGKYFDHVVLARVRNKKHAFGSSSTYDLAAVTGSRTDIVIEDMKEPSLAPFFQVQPKTAEVTATIEKLQAVASDAAQTSTPKETPNASLASSVSTDSVPGDGVTGGDRGGAASSTVDGASHTEEDREGTGSVDTQKSSAVAGTEQGTVMSTQEASTETTTEAPQELTAADVRAATLARLAKLKLKK